MQEQPLHMGVDYGAVLAGTTAAAMLKSGRLQVWQSSRGQNADAWLTQLVEELKPTSIFMDAPLTLPNVYAQEPYTPTADFFYRKCDREVNAMSPLFIGGLTARAIRLRTQLAANGVAVLETYPSQLQRLILPKLTNYKKGFEALPAFVNALQNLISFPFKDAPTNWHQFDALLAWYSGLRHLSGESILYGEATEGRIIV